jgi:hypothetical protein
MECPECGEVVEFRNILSFDKEKFEVLGVTYALMCKKCECAFVPAMRMMSDKKTLSKDVVKALDKLNDFCKGVKK